MILLFHLFGIFTSVRDRCQFVARKVTSRWQGRRLEPLGPLPSLVMLFHVRSVIQINNRLLGKAAD